MRYERPQLIDFRSCDVSGDPQACFSYGGLATSQCQTGGNASGACFGTGTTAGGDCTPTGYTALGS
jgi:hypothetical protein